jgi:hemin uptake protein HemP
VVNSEIPIAGSYFGRQNDMIIQDDGTIYLAGLDQFGRYIIVRGEPL